MWLTWGCHLWLHSCRNFSVVDFLLYSFLTGDNLSLFCYIAQKLKGRTVGVAMGIVGNMERQRMNNNQTYKRVGALALAVILILSSCAKSENDLSKPVQAEKQNRSVVYGNELEDSMSLSINDYLSNLDSWDKLAPYKKEGAENVGTVKNELKTIRNSEGKMQLASCDVQEVDLTKNPEKVIMQNPAGGILYPGALIQGSGYLLGPGGLKELTIRDRAPMELAVDIAASGNSITVDKMNYANYQNALAKMITELSEKGAKPQANIFFNQVTANTSQQAALDLGISVKYLGQKLEADIQSKNDSSESTVMAYFEQRAFTVSAIAPDSPAGFFSPSMTVEKMKEYEQRGAISASNPPLYVSNVSYGRILIFTVTAKASSEDIKAALKGGFNNGATKVDADIKANYKKIMNEAKINIINLSADTDAVKELIKSGDLTSYFSNKKDSLLDFVPISYTIRNVKDNSLATVGETARYSTVSCTPFPPRAWKVALTFTKVKAHHVGASFTGEIYGTIKMNGKIVWKRSRESYLKVKKGGEFDLTPERNSFTVNLSTAQVTPMLVAADLNDNDESWLNVAGKDEVLATIRENIGYDNDGKVLPDGEYSIDHKNMEIFYKVKRIEPIY